MNCCIFCDQPYNGKISKQKIDNQPCLDCAFKGKLIFLRFEIILNFNFLILSFKRFLQGLKILGKSNSRSQCVFKRRMDKGR